jgi:hypothetical protein
LAKYAALIHLRTPNGHQGYNFQNALRTETAVEAAVIDKKIEAIWSRHSHYIQIPSFANFLEKAAFALAEIQKEAPDCCPGV